VEYRSTTARITMHNCTVNHRPQSNRRLTQSFLTTAGVPGYSQPSYSTSDPSQRNHPQMRICQPSHRRTTPRWLLKAQPPNRAMTSAGRCTVSVSPSPPSLIPQPQTPSVDTRLQSTLCHPKSCTRCAHARKAQTRCKRTQRSRPTRRSARRRRLRRESWARSHARCAG
jgi:hypothetical protein